MRYKALVSFTGKVSMAQGEVGEISDPAVVDDLVRAGYIIPFVADKKESKEDSEEKPKRKGKAK